MNIQQAKQEIHNTLRAYHRKDEKGNYIFPISRQRPIFLVGPPGIGKTAILEQIARESGAGLVSYTLTHHTRQSAVGLPHIEQVEFAGKSMTVTQYTMSEIIASIYAYMEKTGKREGILFLDEINCVSETLAPTMLQLLQNKTFGSHQVPEGWIIVTAGNPPEYNKSVREFDVATLDRVRTIPVEADAGVWLSYARQHRVHGAILSYLAIRPEHFYLVEDGAQGRFFVTARGWEDLSEILRGYEALDVPVGKDLVSQYLQKQEVAEAFAAYYQMYRKFHADYGIPEILRGELTGEGYGEKVSMAKAGGFEERFTVVELLADALEPELSQYARTYESLQALHEKLSLLKNGQTLRELTAQLRRSLEIRRDAGILEGEALQKEQSLLARLEGYGLQLEMEHIHGAKLEFDRIKTLFSEETEEFSRLTDRVGQSLESAFRFAEACFGDGQELVLLVTDLTASDDAMAYIGRNGCPAFLRHRDAMLFRQQEQKLQQQCRNLRNG